MAQVGELSLLPMSKHMVAPWEPVELPLLLCETAARGNSGFMENLPMRKLALPGRPV